MDEAKMSRNEISAMIKELLGPELETVKKAAAQRDHLATREMIGGTEQKTEFQKGEPVAQFIKAIAVAEGDHWSALKFAERTYGNDSVVTKALSANLDVTGGFLVPEQLSSEIIEFLRPASVVRSMGARVMPLNNLQMSIPKITGGATANYVGENVNIMATQQAFGQITLAAKKLAALVPISNELLQVNTAAADQIVRDDLVKALAMREDLAFIRGDGTANTPKGILNWADSGNLFYASEYGTGVTLQTVTNDLASCILMLRKANIPMTNCGWIMSPRTEYFLMTVRDSLGNYAFQPEMSTGKLLRFPYAVTTQIPENILMPSSEDSGTSGGLVGTEIYFLNFDDAFIGDAMEVRIDVSNTAAYYDGMNVVATFSEDQTVIRAVSMHDFAMRYNKAAAVMRGVDWGAVTGQI
jgi:HK97 family phage major capsid protein